MTTTFEKLKERAKPKVWSEQIDGNDYYFRSPTGLELSKLESMGIKLTKGGEIEIDTNPDVHNEKALRMVCCYWVDEDGEPVLAQDDWQRVLAELPAPVVSELIAICSRGNKRKRLEKELEKNSEPVGASV